MMKQQNMTVMATDAFKFKRPHLVASIIKQQHTKIQEDLHDDRDLG